MKKSKHISFLIISVLIFTMVIPSLILTFSNVAIVNATTIALNKQKMTLSVGNTYNLKITGTTKIIKWSSSDSTVAAVSNKGKVTAKKKGTSTITAMVNSKKYYCKVTISSKYKNGVFEGSGTGFRNGTTTVSVTINNDKITNIKVTSNEDTPRFFNYASPKIINEILNSQSTNVDAVSGATFSSMGITDAVKNALSKAKN